MKFIFLIFAIFATLSNIASAEYGSRPWIINRFEEVFNKHNSEVENENILVTSKLSPVIFGER